MGSFRKKELSELNRLSPQEFQSSQPQPVSVLCEDIRSAQNIGAIFRTADAFRLQCLYLCGITPTPPHKGIQKTAIGASLTVPWKYFANSSEALHFLRKQHENLHLMAVEQTMQSTDLLDWKVPQEARHLLLILGNEVNGVSQEVLNQVDEVIEISQYGTKHSLNVSVTAGIVLFEVNAQILRSNFSLS